MSTNCHPRNLLSGIQTNFCFDRYYKRRSSLRSKIQIRALRMTGIGSFPKVFIGIQVTCHPQLDWGSRASFLQFFYLRVTKLSFLPHLYIWRVYFLLLFIPSFSRKRESRFCFQKFISFFLPFP